MTTTPIVNTNIQDAVNLWCSDPAEAETTYGHISGWDTSQVTDMSDLFKGKSSFNDDITGWDVSNVTNMSYMFEGSYRFNQDISIWDVSNVTNMSSMFSQASDFNQDLSNWIVSNVQNMYLMFGGSNFNHDISNWDVSKVTDMRYMFQYNGVFNQDAILSWNLHESVNLSRMFEEATAWLNADHTAVTPDRSDFGQSTGGSASGDPYITTLL